MLFCGAYKTATTPLHMHAKKIYIYIYTHIISCSQIPIIFSLDTLCVLSFVVVFFFRRFLIILSIYNSLGANYTHKWVFFWGSCSCVTRILYSTHSFLKIIIIIRNIKKNVYFYPLLSSNRIILYNKKFICIYRQKKYYYSWNLIFARGLYTYII